MTARIGWLATTVPVAVYGTKPAILKLLAAAKIGGAKSRSSRVLTLGIVALMMAGIGGIPKANAAYIVNVVQDGANVVATGSGSLNTDALTNDGSIAVPDTRIEALSGWLSLNTSTAVITEYANITGPSSFGSGVNFSANASAGTAVWIDGYSNWLGVQLGYTSGTSLGTSSDTWDNTTIADLGLNVGTYVWTWGSGATADSFTINVGVAQVPEPSSLALLGIGLACLGSLEIMRRSNAV